MKKSLIATLAVALWSSADGIADTLEQRVFFQKVEPSTIYNAYLSSAAHSEFTGFPAVIEAKEGGSMKAFLVNGIYGLEGKITQLDPGLHSESKFAIVQTWRGVHYAPTDLDSTLSLTFEKVNGGTNLHLVHVNVPDAISGLILQSWNDRYWSKLKGYLPQSEGL